MTGPANLCNHPFPDAGQDRLRSIRSATGWIRRGDSVGSKWIRLAVPSQLWSCLATAELTHGPTPVRFGRLALAGHAAGQVIAQIAAYSFRGIDALVVGGWGDPVITTSRAGMMALAPAIVTCASGRLPKRPGGAGGYAYTFEGQVPELPFHEADPKVVDAFVARHEP